MTDTVTLVAERRDRVGKGAARATRRAGRVPAVIYGGKQEPLLISLDPKELRREFHRLGFFKRHIAITLDGVTHLTQAKDVQLHPVTDEAEHVDLLRVTVA